MTTLLHNMGVPAINEQIKSIVQQQDDLTNSLNDKVAKINGDPWTSEAMRAKLVGAAQTSYDTKKTALTTQLTMYQNIYDKSVQQAQYMTTTALNEYNSEATRMQNETNAAAT